MSEQQNPTSAEPAAQSPQRAERAGASTRRHIPDDDDIETGADYDYDDDEMEDEGDYEDEYADIDGSFSAEDEVSGPTEYVPRERGGRTRRIGSDVRVDEINYKNIPLLSRFLDQRSRILSRRKTRVSAKVQRRIVKAIKRARHLALLPYTADQARIVRKRR